MAFKGHDIVQTKLDDGNVRIDEYDKLYLEFPADSPRQIWRKKSATLGELQYDLIRPKKGFQVVYNEDVINVLQAEAYAAFRAYDPKVDPSVLALKAQSVALDLWIRADISQAAKPKKQVTPEEARANMIADMRSAYPQWTPEFIEQMVTNMLAEAAKLSAQAAPEVKAHEVEEEETTA